MATQTMATQRGAGPLVLVGGGEWGGACRELDAELLAAAGAEEVVVLPTAAAYEHPERVGVRATEWFGALGVEARSLAVLRRADAEDPKNAEIVRKARYVHVADGSPLHLRSVLKGSALFDAMLSAWSGGAALVASGAGATLLCDPMVDPRGGAYTVGLGVVRNLAVFPYHGTAAAHLRERSIDLLPLSAVLAGIDEDTALVLEDGAWRVAGAGAVTVYSRGVEPVRYGAGDSPIGLPG
jgi:cyanophycinase